MKTPYVAPRIIVLSTTRTQLNGGPQNDYALSDMS